MTIVEEARATLVDYIYTLFPPAPDAVHFRCLASTLVEHLDNYIDAKLDAREEK